MPSCEYDLPVVPLLEGREDPSLVRLRYNTFRELWATQEKEIEVHPPVSEQVVFHMVTFSQEILHETDSGVLADIAAFIGSASSEK